MFTNAGSVSPRADTNFCASSARSRRISAWCFRIVSATLAMVPSLFRKREGTMASVAETIRKHHAEILRLRAEEAQKFVSARGLTEPAFVNILPSYLSSLSEADDKLGRVGSERRALLESHLGARLRQGFNIADIADELALLRRCISRIEVRAPEVAEGEVRHVSTIDLEGRPPLTKADRIGLLQGR